MLSLNIATLALFLSAAAAVPSKREEPKEKEPEYKEEEPTCLDKAEALDISQRWLAVFDSPGGVASKEELATIVTENITSYDETFGAPAFGIDELWASIDVPAAVTTANITYTVQFLVHDCDQIAYNWLYEAVSTGVNTTLAVGTPVSITGNDIIRVDLESRLISNSTSAGNWILLAQQLGAGSDCSVV